MRLAVRLLGFHGFPAVEADLVEGVMQVSLPENATVEDLLRHLANTYGPIFTPDIAGGRIGVTRIHVFVADQTLDDWQTPLAVKPGPQAEVCISLLRPLSGG